MNENQNQHAPCPFCGGTELVENASDFILTRARIYCVKAKCGAVGPIRQAGSEADAVAAAWEAWDAAGKREEAK